MIRKSMPSGLTRGWVPVFPRDKREAFARRSCSNKKIERDDDSKKSHPALDQPRLPQLPDAPRIVDSAHGLFAPPRSTFALDCKQVVGRGWIAAMCDRGCRGHADRGYRAVRSVDPYRRMNVIMPVQDQLHAVLLENGQQLR